MVDNVYKKSIPELRKTLVGLKDDFSRLDTKTNWNKLRIEPLLRHLESLEEVLNSKAFSTESSRLRKGVVLFHSDLVYYRTNVTELRKILASERRGVKK